MKGQLFFILCIVTCSISYAQDQGKTTRRSINTNEKRCMFTFSPGMNIDLIHSSSNPNAKLFSTRPTVAPSFGARFTHLTTRKFGIYANIQINFYKEKKSAFYDPTFMDDFIEHFFDKVFFNLSAIHPSLDTGFIYRIERNRWKIHPSLGIGYVGYLSNTRKDKFGEEATENSFRYKQDASVAFLSFGLSTSYFLSRRSFLTLNATLQQPLQKAYASLTRIENGVEAENRYYETRTGGRSLNISLGYGFTFGRTRR